MFVIMTNFFVQLVVENLLKVLKTQVFHILYFLDYCYKKGGCFPSPFLS